MKNNQKIPEGWSVKKLSEVSTFCGGSTPSRAHSEYFNGNIAWVKTTDLNNSILYKTEEKITQLGLNNSSCKVIKKGAVCVAMYGGFNQIGRTCLLGVNAAINQALIAIIPNKELLNLYLLLNLNHNVKTWKLYAGSSRKDPNITKKDIEDFKIIFPPLSEQEKIAGILGTWDEAIEKLSSLIEQKKLLKKGLLQRLLSGKTRLNGFTQPWKEVKLGEITEFKKGKQLNKLDMIDEGLYPVLNGGISYSGYTNNWNTEKNTITISEGGNSCGYVSYIQERFWSGGHCYTLDKIKVDKIYLYQLLKFEENNLMKLRVGSGLPNIQLSSLNKFKVNIPTDANEQKAIADVLSTADEEIDLLNKKLEALKEQKKGLMQQLLTGQTRVKVN